MKEKTLILTAIILTAIAITGLIYFHWRNATTDHNTIRFTEPLHCSDNEATIDVGEFNCQYQNPDPEEGWKTLSIELSNAYPDYAVHCDFTLKNIGNETDTIENITVSDPTGNLQWEWTTSHIEGSFWKDLNGNNAYDPNEEVINITLTDLIGIELDPDETMTAQINVQIAQNAQQRQAYNFQVTITYEEEQP
jgi:hypothetical protein